MKKLLQAAGVAGLVLFGAVGCSTCCPWSSKSACADGQCATPTTASHMGTPGVTGSAMPTTMVTSPGRSPMMSVNQMPATGSMPMGPVGTTGKPGLMPQ